MQVKKNKLELILGALDATGVVMSTMGPYGAKVMVNTREGVFTHTDGVTVAKNLIGWDYQSPFGTGVRVVLNAAERTVEAAGDGTTTTCAIVHGILKEVYGYPEKDEEREPNRWTRADTARMKAQMEGVIKTLEEMADDVTEEQLKNLGIVAANNNEQIGTAIAEMIWKLGKKSHVIPAKSMNGKTYCETISGYMLPGGISSIEMLKNEYEVVLSNAMVVIAEERLEDYKDLLPVMQLYQSMAAVQSGNQITGYNRPLVIVAGDISYSALTFVVQNNAKGIPVYVVRLTDDRRIDILTDLGAYTGAYVYSAASGKVSKMRTPEHFGSCKTVIISQSETRFIGGQNIDDYRAKLQDRVEKAKDKMQQEWLEERISRLDNSVGVVHIGGVTNIEHDYIKDVVEDCVLSCQMAMEKGVLPGSGVALVRAVVENQVDFPLMYGLLQPRKTLFANGGMDDQEFTDGVYDLVRDEYDKEGRIIDSTASVVESVKNAVSLACEIMETETMIIK